MKAIRWWRLLTLLVTAVAWWGCSPAEAQANTRDNCLTEQLRPRSVEAELRFSQRHQAYVKVYSGLTVKVPRKWDLAQNLTFSEDSKEYRRAMRCLLLGPKGKISDTERRPHDPTVTAEGDTVTVKYDAFTWIQNYGTVRLGPWVISTNKKKEWEVALRTSTLGRFPWKRIEATLDGLNFNDHSKPEASFADANRLVWKDEMPRNVVFDVDLPWQRSLSLVYDRSFWGTAGVAAWWVCASCVIVLAALRSEQPYPSAAQGTPGSPNMPGWYSRKPRWWAGNGRGENPVATALQWALLSTAVALTLLLIVPQQSIALRWRSLICIFAGLALLLVARPWHRGMPPAVTDTRTDGSADPDDAPRRQARAVIATASVVAAAGLLVVLAPALFGLPADLVPKAKPTVSGLVGLALMGLTTVWLWLAAMAAWAWRFAREGGLVRTSWTHTWDTAPGRCVAAASALVAVTVGALLACIWWSSESQWIRTGWLTDRSGSFTDDPYVNKFMATFSFTDLLWVYSHSWILTVIALLALLYFRVRTQRAQVGNNDEQLSLRPDTPELLLIAAVFSFLVGLQGGKAAGSSGLFGIWIPLNIISLYVVVGLGRQWSVLGELGDCFCSKLLGSKKRRRELLTKARQYRSVNHQLYLLDQGRGGSATRQQLEDQLHRLRQWVVSGCNGKNPPEHISVLDVALAWGPRDHWWSNAVHSARLAFWFGVPASAAAEFLDLKNPWNWLQFLYTATGIPDVVANFFLYQLAWTGAGFVLGALWRLLPGSSSLMRAWSLTLAYAMPVCIAVLISSIRDAGFGPVLLYALLMLIVLTLTGFWMDTATFRHERDLWRSRSALLLSIYQVRGFSTRLAWLLAQMALAAGIWKQLFHG
ncbi:DUF6185 family protein [Streptomyces sp. NPDC020362]|uniref:DUF6185 family protein n=1 Tax=unclassified Streptomyces TaxID=2593676 RepID=UPI0033E24884